MTKAEVLRKNRRLADSFFEEASKNCAITSKAEISGRICDKIHFDHEEQGVVFYKTQFESKRFSGAKDLINVVFKDVFLRVISSGNLLNLRGVFCTRNNLKEIKGKRLEMYLEVREVEEVTDAEINMNYVYLEGTICKEPLYRITPLGSEITELLLAVDASNGRSFYFPCIAWNMKARYISSMHVGDEIEVLCRAQSRVYFKKYFPDSEEGEWKTTYELSVIKFTDKLRNNKQK